MEIVELKCKGCHAPLPASTASLDIDRDVGAVTIKPGRVITCDYCDRSHVFGETKDHVWGIPKVVVAATSRSVAIGGSVRNSVIITGKS